MARPATVVDPLSSDLLPSERPVQLIDQDSVVHEDARYPMPSLDDLVRGFRALVVGRRVNDQAGALVRQGRLAVYPSSHGQEACQVAAALVLSDQDWLFPTYRDTVAVMTRNVDPVEVMVLLRGTWHSGYDPIATKVAPQATPLATQLVHAVGVAHAARLKGEDSVVVAMCGDGATSEGDFHEALNFAAVFHTPVVFFVQNNEYAISVPLAKQSAAPSLAHKGVGYGIPGERVDGNDLAAVLSVLSGAVERARGGGGPSLIEAHTYRMQAHTNADDAGRYRGDAEVAAWLPKDPLMRMKRYLTENGALDADLEAQFAREADEVAQALRNGLSDSDDGEPEADPDDLFAYVYSEPTAALQEQSVFLAEERSREEDA